MSQPADQRTRLSLMAKEAVERRASALAVAEMSVVLRAAAGEQDGARPGAVAGPGGEPAQWAVSSTAAAMRALKDFQTIDAADWVFEELLAEDIVEVLERFVPLERELCRGQMPVVSAVLDAAWRLLDEAFRDGFVQEVEELTERLRSAADQPGESFSAGLPQAGIRIATLAHGAHQSPPVTLLDRISHADTLHDLAAAVRSVLELPASSVVDLTDAMTYRPLEMNGGLVRGTQIVGDPGYYPQVSLGDRVLREAVLTDPRPRMAGTGDRPSGTTPQYYSMATSPTGDQLGREGLQSRQRVLRSGLGQERGTVGL